MNEKRRPKPRGYWTESRAAQVARNYRTRSQFQKAQGRAYQVLSKLGRLDELFPYIYRQDKKRCVYAITSKSKNLAYIGITSNFEAREYGHRRMDTPSTRYLSSLEDVEFNKLSDYLREEEAQKQEVHFYKIYKNKKWVLLNTESALGALGGRASKWTEITIKNEVKKYKTIKGFELGNSGACQAARALGLMDDLFERQLVLGDYWKSESNVRRAAKNCETRQEFYKTFSAASKAPAALKIMDELFPRIPKDLNWYTYENVKPIASRYNSISEFKKDNAHTYLQARKNGIIDRLFTRKIVPSGHWFEIDNIKAAASECETISEFASKYVGAYKAARKLGILYDLFESSFKPDGYWENDVNIRNAAKGFSKRSDFKKAWSAGYNSAIKKGMLDELFPKKHK